MESNALQRNSLQKNRQKSGIDCNVIAFVSGLRCTLSKTAVQRNPLQKFKIPTFGTVMTLEAMIGQEVERIRSQTPMLTSSIGCSTEIPQAADATQPDALETPIRSQSTSNTEAIDHDHAGKARLKQTFSDESSSLDLNQEPRRSERIRSAKRVVKLGGVEYF